MIEEVVLGRTSSNHLGEEPASKTRSSLPRDIRDLPVRTKRGVGHLDGNRALIAGHVANSPGVLIDLHVLANRTSAINVEVSRGMTLLPHTENALSRETGSVVVKSDRGLLVSLVGNVTGSTECIDQVLHGPVI